MPEYTPAEIDAIAARVIDRYIKGQPIDSASFDKPTLKKFVQKRKQFKATKGNISLPVRLKHGNDGTRDSLAGITPGEELEFYNPSNARRAEYTRRKHHIGMSMTEDELEDYGITITDEMGGTSAGSASDHAVLMDALKEKASDFNEQFDEKANTLLWSDGTADANAMAGIRAIVLDDPTSGTVGGISCGLNAKWRNRAYTSAHAASGGTDKITSSTSGGGELIQVLTKDLRQLMRFGGRPDYRPAGSDFLDALEREIRANGEYAQMGFAKDHELGFNGLALGGVPFIYDPELDNIGREKYAYALDCRHINLHTRDGLWKKVRKPARPYNKFVMHQSLVATAQVCADQLNCHAVYQIA